jgi:hypothetical protein
MIPTLKESTEIDKDFVEKNKGYLTEKLIPEKEEMLKRYIENQYGELLLSDKQGDIIATADYNISIENGKPIIHKIENFEFEKINAEGLNINSIQNDLENVSESQIPGSDEITFVKDDDEMGLEM